MAMIGKVRRMHRREKRSIREIARTTSLSRNTIRKWLKRPLEGVAGKIKTEQLASIKNQPVVNRLVGQALGLAPDEPLTNAAPSRVRSQAGQAYEAVKQSGTVQLDQTFQNALNAITAKYQGAGKSFPGLSQNSVPDLIDKLRVPQAGADSVVDAISVLRETADTAFGSGDASLGRASREAAKALEDQLGRHLQTTGASGDLLKGYTEARALIAKTYDVQKALTSGGNVDGRKLADALRKGRPLTDELRTVAEFSAQMPKATQPAERLGSATGPSVLDMAFGTGLTAAGGIPGGLAWVTGRPIVRSGLLTAPYQRVMTTPSYRTPLAEHIARATIAGPRRLPAEFQGVLANYLATQGE